MYRSYLAQLAEKPVVKPPKPKPKPVSTSDNMTTVFDASNKTDRPEPPKPSIEGIDYMRAAAWASGSCTNVLADDKGRALFRYFLYQSLADENLSFIEAVDRLKKMKSSDEKKKFAEEIIDTYCPYVNLSSVSMKKIKDAAAKGILDAEDFAPAIKEVRRLLENDQFPRFRRSEVYLEFLEQLLPRQTAERWATSFEALLGNHVGRHHFRLFLRNIRAEENLRFWEAVVEFRGTRNKSPAMLNMAKILQQTYLMDGCANEVFLPYGVRQTVEQRILLSDVDIGIFDEAVKHVEQLLRNDPYVRYLQCRQYAQLLAKLKPHNN